MPRPDSAVQRPDLGAVAYEYIEEDKTFIGASIMPVFPVPQQSMEYPVIPIEALIKQRTNLRRAARGDYPRADWEWKLQNFATREYGWEELIDDKEANLYARFFDAEVVATDIAMGILMRGHEGRVQAILAASTNTTAGTDWGTPATATPYKDVDTAAQEMRDEYGCKPNAIAMGKKVYDRLIATDELREYMKYTSPHLLLGEEAKRDTVARYFGLDQVLVGDTQEDTEKRGKAASLADIWPNTEAYVLKVSPGGPNLRVPSVGRTFMWTGDAPDLLVVESYREEKKRSEVIRVRQDVDEAVQYKGAIRKLTGVGT